MRISKYIRTLSGNIWSFILGEVGLPGLPGAKGIPGDLGSRKYRDY